MISIYTKGFREVNLKLRHSMVTDFSYLWGVQGSLYNFVSFGISVSYAK